MEKLLIEKAGTQKAYKNTDNREVKGLMPYKKINILYVINNLLIGGAQELIKTLSLNLDRELFNVSVCSLIEYDGKGEKEPLTEEIAAGGVDITTLHMKGWRDNKEKKKLIRLLKEKETDVIHSHLYPSDLWASYIAKSAGVPVKIFSKHETYYNKSLLRRLLHFLIYNVCVDKALASSEITKDHLIKYGMINPLKIGKIYNPIDTERFNPLKISGGKAREEFGIPPDAPVIGNVSRFVPRKGIEFFIETCFKVSKVIPESWFILVGYGEDEYKYRELVKFYDIQERFIFVGARRYKPDVVSAIDIFLFTPIWGEALPIVMLDAMSMKKAIVASNVCSNRELITNEVSGLLPVPETWSPAVDKLDTTVLADSVIRLLKAPELCESFGKQARLRAEKIFGLPVIIKQLEALYIKLLRQKNEKYV